MRRCRLARVAALAVWLVPLLGSLPALAQPAVGALSVSSPAIRDGAALPQAFTCENVLEPSPPLSWAGGPPETKSYAVVLDAPERPGDVGVWWVVFNIPRAQPALETNQLPTGASQAVNDLGKLGYSAPCPPSNTRWTFRFTVYALDLRLPLGDGAGIADVTAALEGHVLAQGELTATYLRPSWPWG